MKCWEGPCTSSRPREKKKRISPSLNQPVKFGIVPSIVSPVGVKRLSPPSSSTDAVAFRRRRRIVLLTLLQLLIIASSTVAMIDLKSERRSRLDWQLTASPIVKDPRVSPRLRKVSADRQESSREALETGDPFDLSLVNGGGVSRLGVPLRGSEQRLHLFESPNSSSPVAGKYKTLKRQGNWSTSRSIHERQTDQNAGDPSPKGRYERQYAREEDRWDIWEVLTTRGITRPTGKICDIDDSGKAVTSSRTKIQWTGPSRLAILSEPDSEMVQSTARRVLAPEVTNVRSQSSTPPEFGGQNILNPYEAPSSRKKFRIRRNQSHLKRLFAHDITPEESEAEEEEETDLPEVDGRGSYEIVDIGDGDIPGEAIKFKGDVPFLEATHDSRNTNKGTRNKRKIDVSSVSIVEGEDAALPCDLSSPSPGDTVQIILWIKEGLHTPLYSYDYRELQRGRPRETKPDANSTLSRKTNFRIDRTPAALIIEDAEAGDSGIYRCRVDFLHSPTLNYRVNLTVVVPPTEVRISWREENGTLISASGNEAGPFLEHSRPILICSNDDGWPPPSVLWYEGSQLLDESYKFHSDRETVENSITFDPLMRADLGRNLTCVVSNTNRTRPAAKSVTVTLKLRIMGVKVNSLGILWAGEEARAECEIWGSRPPPVVLWWLGPKMLPPTETRHLDDAQNVTLSYLDFFPKAVDDGAMLICQATNEMLPDQAVQDSTILIVNYVPVVNVHLGRSLDPDKIKEGDDVYFECSVSSKPPAINVVWKHNGQRLKPGPGLILSNVSLVVQGVTRDHGGNYTCHATNVRGTSTSQPLHLDVKYTPVCATKQRQQHSVGKEENAEISCKVDANPKEVTFRWTFNNTAEAIDVPQGRFGVAGTESRVNYTPMNELDYGTLLCWANNSIGIQQFPCVFQIVAAGKPDPPHNCRVFDVTISSLQVNCLPGDDGGLKQTFMLQVYKVGSTVPVDEVTRTFPSFSVRDLTPATSYRIAMAALNEKGASRMIELHAYTLKVMDSLEETSAEPTRDRDRGAGIPLAVLIGAVVAFVPVVVASIVLVWLKVRRGARPPDEGSRNVIGCDSGSEVDANTHSSHSRDPTTSTDFAALSDISIPEGANPDVVLIGDAPAWTAQRTEISTISASPYMTANAEKRYTASTRIAKSMPPAKQPVPSSEGGSQYTQIMNQEHSCSHPEASGNHHLPGNMASKVPYYVDSDKFQQVKRTPTRSPVQQKCESNIHQFASNVEANSQKRCSEAVVNNGKEDFKGCPCWQGTEQNFPHLLPGPQEPISKSVSKLTQNSVHRCHSDSSRKKEGLTVQTLPRKGSLKSFAQCSNVSPRQQPASIPSFRNSVEDVSRNPAMSIKSGMPQNKPNYQTASLTRSKREQRSLDFGGSQTNQHMMKLTPTEWPWKHKRESAV